MEIITVANFKGGSGKTSTALNLAAGLARKNKKVLLMDCDPQCDLTNGTVGFKDFPYTTVDVFNNRALDCSKAIPVWKNVDILPASLILMELELTLVNQSFREHILLNLFKEQAAQIPYDFIIIDTAPNLGNLTINAVTAADFVLCPVEAEFFSMKGFYVFRKALKRVNVSIDGMIITKYDSRKNLNKDVLSQFINNDTVKDIWFDVIIRDNIKIAESPLRMQNIFDYKGNSYGSEDYKKLTTKILSHDKRSKI